MHHENIFTLFYTIKSYESKLKNELNVPCILDVLLQNRFRHKVFELHAVPTMVFEIILNEYLPSNQMNR